jgi:hypothetical protein
LHVFVCRLINYAFSSSTTFLWQLIKFLSLCFIVSKHVLVMNTVLPRSIAPRFIANLAYHQNSRLSRFPLLKYPVILWQLIKLQILIRIKSTNVITRKVNTGNYSNQNNWSPIPQSRLSPKFSSVPISSIKNTPLYCQTQLPPSATGFQTQKS